MDKAVLTCALTGVLTDPRRHAVPVSPAQMASSAREAWRAGAAVVHLHFRSQAEGAGHLPSWEPELAAEVDAAVRAACPGIVVNQSTGVIGPDVSGPVGCLRRIRPEIAACNAGSLNYLKLRDDGSWAWPPLLFDNPVEKVKAMLDAMAEVGALPEFECFDVGMVRSIELYLRNGMAASARYNFVMGVSSGMPVDAELLALLLRWRRPGCPWQATLIGREEIWPVHRRAAELGGMLRTGLEDTFYLPDGSRAAGNGHLVEALAACARRAGREVASPEEARRLLGAAARSGPGTSTKSE
jgi:3-keto-5-aminohexanoate cleavage enzyme